MTRGTGLGLQNFVFLAPLTHMLFWLCAALLAESYAFVGPCSRLCRLPASLCLPFPLVRVSSASQVGSGGTSLLSLPSSVPFMVPDKADAGPGHSVLVRGSAHMVPGLGPLAARGRLAAHVAHSSHALAAPFGRNFVVPALQSCGPHVARSGPLAVWQWPLGVLWPSCALFSGASAEKSRALALSNSQKFSVETGIFQVFHLSLIHI